MLYTDRLVNHRSLLLIVISIFLLHIVSSPLSASVDTVNITTDGGVGSGSLRDLIENRTADTIVFNPTLNGSSIDVSNPMAININRDLVIIGNGSSNTTIDGGGNAGVFSITNGRTVAMSRLSITNGNNATGDGGGIYNDGSILTLDSVTVSECTALNGGGIAHHSGTLLMTNSTLMSNTARDTVGGGLSMLTAATATIDQSIIRSNSITDGLGGGGIYCSGDLRMNNSAVESNRATNSSATIVRGGGIYSPAVGTLTIDNSRISYNVTTSSFSTSGGGIFNLGQMTLTNSEIDNNSSRTDGGGVFGHGDISNCIITNNTANSGNGGGISLATTEGPNNIVMRCIIAGNTALNGGGIMINDDTLMIVNCAIFGNNAEEIGGGVFAGDQCTWSLFNSTIAGNLAIASGGGVHNETERAIMKSNIMANNRSTGSNPDLNDVGLINNRGHNLIEQSPYGNFMPRPTDILGLDPMFVTPVGIMSPTTTGDLNLRAGSPAIDRGMVVQDTTPAIDLDGDPRVNGASVEIGAYEFRSSPSYSFGDPCDCTDPLNYEANGIYYFHDALTYVNNLADTVLIDSTNTTNFFTTGGNLYSDSTAFTEVNDSTFTINYWRRSGTAPNLHIFIRTGTIISPFMLADSSFLQVCDVALCPGPAQIPTLSEWGMIILLLAMMIVSVSALRFNQQALPPERH